MKNHRIFIVIFVIMALTISFSSVAEGKPFTKPVGVSAPTQGLPTDPGQLIQQIFTWSLAVLGIAVFVMFFYAGFLYLTAAGNSANVSEAKSRMTNAVFGAILLLSSYLILNTINPNFVKNTFNLPGLGPQSALDPALEKDDEGPTCDDDPEWQACQTENRKDLVQKVHDYVISKGINVTGSCGGFEIVKRVAWKLRDEETGVLKTFHSSRCDSAGGLSGDLLAYSDGSLVDILSLRDDDSVPLWLPIPGPITESGIEYVAPTDPGDPAGSY